MTATPIPRTMAMTLYADLNVSVIDALPPGRRPVQTIVLPQSKRDEVVERIDKQCAAGKQVYWVCPLIEQSENFDWQAAEKTLEDLQLRLPNRRIGLIHGKKSSHEKEQIMQTFKTGEIDLLVATTVIEVGVQHSL